MQASDTSFDQIIRGWRAYVIVAALAFLSSFAIGAMSMSVMDGDEARFAQASRQMAESGDYVRIRLMDAERTKKPIGIYWLQAASARAFEPLTHRLNAIWTYRLPSALGAALAAMATLWAGAALVGRRAAFIGASLLSASILFGIEGMTAKTDAVLLGFTTLAMAALAQIRAGKQLRTAALIFWAAIACAALVKFAVGPLLVVLAVATLVIWERRALWLKPLLWWPGPLLALAILAPWCVAISMASHGGFFTEMFQGDVAPKLAGHDEHGAPPGYYLALLPLLIFPATYFLPAAAQLAWRGARSQDDAQASIRFLIAWAVPLFLFFEIVPSKLVHYTLPTYPAIALLCGAAALSAAPKRFAHPLGLALYVLAGLALAAVLALAASYTPSFSSIGVGVVAASWIAATGIALAFTRGSLPRTAILIVSALAISLTLRGIVVPNAERLNVSATAVAALADAHVAYDDAHPLRIIGYNDASLAFLTRTSTQFVTPQQEAERAHSGDALMIETQAYAPTLAALAQRRLTFAPAAAPISGRTTSDGRALTLHVGRVASQPTGD